MAVTDPRDRVVLSGMRFQARVGVSDAERAGPQPIEVDVEMCHDLSTAGRTDDLAATIDYGRVFQRCREIVEQGRSQLIEAIAERVAGAVIAETPASEVVVRVRKLHVPVEGTIDHAAVHITRRRGVLDG